MSGHAHDEAVIRQLIEATREWWDGKGFVPYPNECDEALAALARLTVDTPGQPPEQATAESGGDGGPVAGGAAPAQTHPLKTWPVYFRAILDGRKTFDVRVNDRDFCVGDWLVLKEWQPQRGYTGRVIDASVSYILHGGQFGIEAGYVVLGLALDTLRGTPTGSARLPDPDLPQALLMAELKADHLSEVLKASRARVGLLEEALRAIRDTPRSVLWKVYDIAAAALAGVETGPGKEHGNAGGTATPLPVAEEGRDV